MRLRCAVPFNLGRFVELRAAGAVQRPSLLDGGVCLTK
jgi:hypothetical protein